MAKKSIADANEGWLLLRQSNLWLLGLSYAAFGDHGTREFFTHVRFHKHEDDNRIVVHLLVELYARHEEEAIEVLEDASRGVLEITSLAEESRPPAATEDRH